jgi:RNA polymerase-binding transcription factor DksA
MATSPAKKATAPAKKTVAKATPSKATATKASATKATPAAKAPATKGSPTPAKSSSAKSSSAKQSAAKKAAPPKKAAATTKAPATKAAVKASSNFDAAFLESQRALLIDERANLLGQAQRLEDEAAELMEDLDPGDVQFDDESGEGDSLVVERERDLALSAQARQTIRDIDAALSRIKDGTYGHSVISGRPIPKERLKAIPWATELVEEKVGGLGSRR